MTFLLIMGMVVLVLLGAVSLLAASATGRLDPPPEPDRPAGPPVAPSGMQLTWSALGLVAGGLLILWAIVAALLREPKALSMLVFGVLYVFKGVKGLRDPNPSRTITRPR